MKIVSDTNGDIYEKDVSIIIPVRSLNDPNVDTCLESIHRQSVKARVEVILVEGGTISQASFTTSELWENYMFPLSANSCLLIPNNPCIIV